MIPTNHFNFIASMDNQHDYGQYVNFCIEHGEDPVSFLAFASIVDPQPTPLSHIVPAKNDSASSNLQPSSACCGGGDVK